MGAFWGTRHLTLSSVSLVLLLLPFCGCSSKSTAQKNLEELRSWAATAELNIEEWSRGHVPEKFALDLLQTIHTKLAALQKKSKADSETGLREVDELDAQIKALNAAIESHNYSAATSTLARLSSQRQQLDSLLQKEP